MTLVLQIALGIVLAVLILRYMRQIIAIGIVGGVLAAVAFMAIMAWILATNHWDVVGPVLGCVAVVAVIGATIQYSARGLGWLYVRRRNKFAQSVRWRRFLRLLGTDDTWLTADRPNAEIARAAGDRLFLGGIKFAGLYLLAFAGVLYLLSGLFLSESPSKSPIPALGTIVVFTSVFLPSVVLYVWLGRSEKVTRT